MGPYRGSIRTVYRQKDQSKSEKDGRLLVEAWEAEEPPLLEANM